MKILQVIEHNKQLWISWRENGQLTETIIKRGMLMKLFLGLLKIKLKWKLKTKGNLKWDG